MLWSPLLAGLTGDALYFPTLFVWGQEGIIFLMVRVLLFLFNQERKLEGLPLKCSVSGHSQIDLQVSKWVSFRCL